MPYQVMERNGNSVTLQSPGKVQYKRNVTEVRKHYKSADAPAVEDDPNEHRVVAKDQGSSDDVQIVNTRPGPVRERRAPDHYGDWVKWDVWINVVDQQIDCLM